MASYGEDCGITSYQHMEVQTINNSGEVDDDLLSTYSMLSPTCFTNLAAFKRCVMDCYDGFVAGSSVYHQYIAFTGVNRKSMSMIDELREDKSSLPKMVVLYDATQEVLIAKIMPSPAHDAAARVFESLIQEKLTLVGVRRALFPVGSGRFGDPDGRCKEGDSAFIPEGRHTDDWPSLVIEVGLSESYQMLKNDARFWLTQSGGQTRVVILLYIDKPSKKILVQRWECMDDIRPSFANVRYLIQVVQSLELVAGVQYAGDALLIPAFKVLDNVPNNVAAGAFLFTPNELQDFYDYYWSRVV